MVRRILITGANKGIGLALTRRCLLDHTDTHVILGVRSLERGRLAVAVLAAEQPSWTSRLTLLQIDVASEASVSAAAARFCEMMQGCGAEPLYAICNNAGIAGGTLEDILTTNTMGPRRVDAAFLPLLDRQAGRIVMVLTRHHTCYIVHP